MTDREHAIEYRRQLLRIVDQIERDYGLGKHAPSAGERLESTLEYALGGQSAPNLTHNPKSSTI